MHIFSGRGLHSAVHIVHIPPMTELSEWMKDANMKDAGLAELTGGKISRSQISRIRRGKGGTSATKAQALAEVTGIPWHSFISGRPQ